MIDDPDVTRMVLYPTGTLVLGWFARALIAKVVKDGSDRAGDRAVIDHIKRQAERINELEDRELTLARERNEAVSLVGGLKAQVTYLTEQVEKLNVRVEELMTRQDANWRAP